MSRSFSICILALATTVFSTVYLTPFIFTRAKEPSPTTATTESALPASSVDQALDAFVPTPRSGYVTVTLPAGVAGNDAVDVLQRKIRTHVFLLRHRTLLTKIMQSDAYGVVHSNVYTDLGKDPEKMKDWLADNLRVRAVPGTPLIEVGLRPTRYDNDAASMVTEIINRYIQDGSEKEFLQIQEEGRFVKSLQTKYRLQFQEDEQRILKLFEAPTEGKGPSVVALRIELARQSLSHSSTRLAEIDDQLTQMDARMNVKSPGEVQWAIMPELPLRVNVDAVKSKP